MSLSKVRGMNRQTPGLTRRAASALRRAGLRSEPLDDDAWLVQRGARRSARRIGPARQRSHLVIDEEHVAAHENGFLTSMGGYLGERHAAWALRRLDVSCVLDVGANTGQFGQRLRRMGYRGRIVSFEPVAATAEKLRQTAADDPDWVVHALALGDEDTTAEINVRPGTMSSLLPSSDFGRSWNERLEDATTETIQVRRLDGILDEALAGLDEPRVFLKMDTQGYDLATLRGAGERVGDVLGLMSEVSCVPIYEGMPRLPEQVSAYEEAGFEVSGFYPVTRHRRTLRAIEFDVIMVRADAVRPEAATG